MVTDRPVWQKSSVQSATGVIYCMFHLQRKELQLAAIAIAYLDMFTHPIKCLSTTSLFRWFPDPSDAQAANPVEIKRRKSSSAAAAKEPRRPKSPAFSNERSAASAAAGGGADAGFRPVRLQRALRRRREVRLRQLRHSKETRRRSRPTAAAARARNTGT